MSEYKGPLTSNSLDAVIRDCLLRDASERETAPFVVVEGVRADFGLSKDRLESHRAAVIAMLRELPDTFMESGGGGHSFLALCEDHTGRLWTGLHVEMEVLCVLAIGLGLGHWCLPRSFWHVLPGGMPTSRSSFQGRPHPPPFPPSVDQRRGHDGDAG